MKININLKFPVTWNQLSEDQLQEVAFGLEYYHRQVKADKSLQMVMYIKLQLHLIKQLLRRNNWFKVMYAIRQIPPSEYTEYTRFLINGNNRTKFPSSFKIKKIEFNGPAERLKNINIAEFSLADSLFYNWKKTANDQYLNLLCATLYRPSSDNDLDRRQPFNKIRVENQLPKITRLNQKKKLAIAYAYEGSRNHIVKTFTNIFPPPPVVNPEFIEESSSQQNDEEAYVPFGKLINHKIGFDPSKLETTKSLNVYDFLGTYDNELAELKNRKK